MPIFSYKTLLRSFAWKGLIVFLIFFISSCKTDHGYQCCRIKFDPKHKPSQIQREERARLEKRAYEYGKADSKAKRKRIQKNGYYSEGRINKAFMKKHSKHKKRGWKKKIIRR